MPLSYRDISLPSCLGKVYTALISHHIVKYCEMLDLMYDEQNGFRSKRSCADHVYVVTSIIRNRLSQGLDTFAAMIDMEKAFDCLKRPFLYFKLLELNIDGKIYNAIKTLYSDNKAFVRVNNDIQTDWFDVPYGVRQGDPLSSTLFNIYINGLAEHLKQLDLGIEISNGLKICILLYADDIILLADSEAALQSLLLVLESWCSQWQLKVNNDKSNVIHFRNLKKPQTKFKFIYDSQELLITNYYKYLGFYLHEFMDLNFNANQLSDSASRALGAINAKFKSLKNISFGAYSKVYHSSVASILDFESETWGYCKAKSADKVQNRALRFILGVHKFCPLPAMSGDVGWLGCKERHFISMIRYWNRLIRMSINRLTKKIFLYDYNIKHNNWSSEIENILESVNLLNTFQTKIMCDISLFESKIRENLHNIWCDEIHKMPKLRTYVLFKHEYKTEEYLKMYLPRSHRSLLAQLRSGILPLRIESGRFQNIHDPNTGKIRKSKPEERVCTLCDLNLLEDEIHFVCICSKYCSLREKLFKTVTLKYASFTVMSNSEKFVFLLKNESKLLANYIYEAWNIENLN